MKTVVITGSARGFGYAMIEEFYKKDFNVVLCDINPLELDKAYNKLKIINGKGKILSYVVDITNEDSVKELINNVVDEVDKIDIWINNAGVNQQMLPIWDLDSKDINRLIDIDLKGTIICSKNVMLVMLKQKFGAIYNVEGYGSNDATMLGLSIYGTCKRAITYFSDALAKESKLSGNYVLVGKITPGIMITNFIDTSMGDGKKIALSDKTKNIYNILGDRPEDIARFMVKKICVNKKNEVKFVWLDSRKVILRFIKALFGKKNNYFE